jgi:hypothetical protein
MEIGSNGLCVGFITWVSTLFITGGVNPSVSDWMHTSTLISGFLFSIELIVLRHELNSLSCTVMTAIAFGIFNSFNRN